MKYKVYTFREQNIGNVSIKVKECIISTSNKDKATRISNNFAKNGTKNWIEDEKRPYKKTINIFE